VLKWNEEALQCIRVTKPGPTIVARALAIPHMSTYNAWSAYDAKAVPTIRTGWTRRPSSQRTVANKSQAVSHAAYIALNDLFPDCRAAFTQRVMIQGEPGCKTVMPWRAHLRRQLLDPPALLHRGGPPGGNAAPGQREAVA
jgi:hypothetical protein